jgi:predicted anti-sigma-YlaC factor YlaD
MSCDEYKPLLSGYVDGELSSEEGLRLRDHLSHCPDCRNDLLQLQDLKEVTDAVKPEAIPDRYWDNYWLGVYNRMERGFGWILFWAGAALLIGFGLWEFVQSFFTDSGTPLIVRIGVGLGAAGLGILFFGVVRERLITRKKDPYREVQR